jgi:hypothetical protein
MSAGHVRVGNVWLAVMDSVKPQGSWLP